MTPTTTNKNEAKKGVGNIKNLEQIANAMDKILRDMKSDIDKLKKKRNTDDGASVYILEEIKLANKKKDEIVDPKLGNLIKNHKQDMKRLSNTSGKARSIASDKTNRTKNCEFIPKKSNIFDQKPKTSDDLNNKRENSIPPIIKTEKKPTFKTSITHAAKNNSIHSKKEAKTAINQKNINNYVANNNKQIKSNMNANKNNNLKKPVPKTSLQKPTSAPLKSNTVKNFFQPYQSNNNSSNNKQNVLKKAVISKVVLDKNQQIKSNKSFLENSRRSGISISSKRQHYEKTLSKCNIIALNNLKRALSQKSSLGNQQNTSLNRPVTNSILSAIPTKSDKKTDAKNSNGQSNVHNNNKQHMKMRSLSENRKVSQNPSSTAEIQRSKSVGPVTKPSIKDTNNHNNNVHKHNEIQKGKSLGVLKQKLVDKQSNHISLIPRRMTEPHILSLKPQVVTSITKNPKIQSNISGNTLNSSFTKRSSSVFSSQGVRNDAMQDVINVVNKAKWSRKTFTVYGNFGIIRKALLQRGWIEKLRVHLVDGDGWRKLETMSNFELLDGMRDKENGDRFRRVLYSKLLARHQVDLYWDYMTNPFTVCSDKVKKTLINRYPSGSNKCFTTKVGLLDSLANSHWYYVCNVAHTLYPRTYNLSIDYEKKAFIDDFRATAATSLLKWVIRIANDNVIQLVSNSGKIPTAVFNFALLQCLYYIRVKQHKDIDEDIPNIEDHEWNIFLDKFYQVIHSAHHFKANNKVTKELMVEQAKDVVNKMEKYYPELRNDGVMNLWILKPHFGCRGCGILVCRTLKFILDTIHQKNLKTKYIVQKYLERPLLIYNTKFDIRQWILVTNQPILHVWMYKDCYLRFSSQTYNLHKLHESIHLTNNSVQSRYKNCNRDTNLPEQNMWHSDSFKEYLENIGHPTVWNKVIYKGMKECLVGVFMMCQDRMYPRMNSFELCGVDFMLTEEFQPYLIEINARPALHWSTKVTAKLCPQVLEDVIKVIVDHARNPKSSTGRFELIYRGQINKVQLSEKDIHALQVQGKPIKIRDPNKSESTIDNKSEISRSTKSESSPLLGQRYKLNKINIKKEIIEAKKQILETCKKVPEEIKEEKKDLHIKTKNPQEIKVSEVEEGGKLKEVLNLGKDDIKKDVKNTLQQILAAVHDENLPQEQKSVRSKEYKDMLSEFVGIISNGTPKIIEERNKELMKK